MADRPNWHDAHALMLIDRALVEGGFTPDIVAEINQALSSAREAPPAAAAAGQQGARGGS